MTNTTGQRSPKQKRSRERVELILNATREVLENEGIKALSTNSIAARGKIPVSSIYQYFPNKEAILSAVYEDYLEKIRAEYEAFDTAENRELPRREYFSRLLKTMHKAESRDNIEAELERALGLYPELMAIDQRHEEWIAEHITASLKYYGSRWPKAKLKRLAHYLYTNNSAIWAYRSRHKSPKKELSHWAETTFHAVADLCFEDAPT